MDQNARIMMSGSVGTSLMSLTKPPLNEGKGGQLQVIWETQFEACLGIYGLGELLNANFDSKLPVI